MNHYPRHVGDYLRDTAHLSLLEHGVYTRLLDVYYTREGPIPADQPERLVSARSREERAAVAAVLAEFFTLTPEGWRQKRCDAEIAAYQDSAEEREQRNTHETERMRRHRERRASMFAALREVGIVPKWDIKMEELQRLYEQNTNAPETRTGGPPETDLQREQVPNCNGGVTANQNQNQNQNQSLSARAPPPTRAGKAALAMRSGGMGSVNPADPRLLALCEAGATDEEFADAAREAGGKGKGFAYALAIVEQRRRDAAKLVDLPAGKSRMDEFRGAI